MRARSICPMVGLGRRPGRERRPYARRFETVRASRSASSLTEMQLQAQGLQRIGSVPRKSSTCQPPAHAITPRTAARSGVVWIAGSLVRASSSMLIRAGAKRPYVVDTSAHPRRSHDTRPLKQRSANCRAAASSRSKTRGFYHLRTVPVYRAACNCSRTAVDVRTGRRYTATHANTTSRSWPWGRFCRSS